MTDELEYYDCQNTDKTIVIIDETITAVDGIMVHKLHLNKHTLTSSQSKFAISEI